MSTLVTYVDGSRREDLIDVVSNISPSETPLVSGLPMGEAATNTLHEYTTDEFAAAADNAQVEGADFSSDTLTQPTRSNNITQIFRKDLQISGTQQAVRGVVDPEDYQVQKNLKELALDMELAYMAGSRASGGTSAARRMVGIQNALTTNRSTRATNSSLTEDEFNNILQLIWESTNKNSVATEVYTGALLKRKVSSFTAGNDRNVSADDKRLVRAVDIYESDFGIVKLFLSRNVQASRHEGIVFINPDFHRQSYLRPIQVEPVSKVGDSVRHMVIGEATLEHRGEKSGAYFDGYAS